MIFHLPLSMLVLFSVTPSSSVSVFFSCWVNLLFLISVGSSLIAVSLLDGYIFCKTWLSNYWQTSGCKSYLQHSQSLMDFETFGEKEGIAWPLSVIMVYAVWRWWVYVCVSVDVVMLWCCDVCVLLLQIVSVCVAVVCLDVPLILEGGIGQNDWSNYPTSTPPGFVTAFVLVGIEISRSQPNCEVKLWYQILVFRILFYAINCKVTTRRYTFFCLPTTNNKAVGLSQVWPHIQEVSASPRSYSTLATR